MKITGFDISNFKGISKAKIRFSDNDSARVHTLVGLNESGKTTLLEAMHSFSPDAETELVVKSVNTASEQREQWIPRDKISNFTGEVSVTAHVTATPEDLQLLRDEYAKETGLKISDDGLSSEFTFRLVHSYKRGDYVSSARHVDQTNLKVKGRRGKNFKEPTTDDLNVFTKIVRRQMPTVAYYPTFVFDFPERIYLTKRDSSPRNRFYRQLFQDILDFDGNGYTIKESILDRLQKEETKGLWELWYSGFAGSTEEDKVKQVISRAERAVTKLIFSKWNEVFGEKAGAKEISIDLLYEKGKILKNEKGVDEEPTTHDAYIRFRIKDGANIYSVDDRSLGFRWFFSFLLFTQFRIHRENQKPTIFLFDEPASNLHAAAQKKLLESFPAIAQPPHRLIYSTHSHYMVEPKWLEQAYIVYNSSVSEYESIIDSGLVEDAKVDVSSVPYRQFVQEQPTHTSYFQPILDTLEIQPSKFDYKIGGLIVEGKSDYYSIKFCELCTGLKVVPVFPARGAGTMGSLVSLHRGWGLPVRVLFDSDRGGKDGKKNLKKEFSLTEEESTGLADLVNGLTSIEDLLSDSDKSKLCDESDLKEKTVLLRRVQESLASDVPLELDETSRKRMAELLKALSIFVARN